MREARDPNTVRDPPWEDRSPGPASWAELISSEWDVLVVGASTSGLFAAECLASSGWRVGVIDRCDSLGSQARSWIVTDHIRTVLGEFPEDAVLHRTSVMELASGTNVRRVALDPPDLVMERRHLIGHLAHRARSAGAVIHTQVSFLEVRPKQGRWEVSVRRNGSGDVGQVICSHLVGADGARSAVGRMLNLSPAPAIPVLQAKVELPDGYDPDVTKVWFDRARTRFFFWLIPESENRGVLGLVPDAPRTARQDLVRFLRHRGLRPREFQGAMIPLHRPFRRTSTRMGDSRILLVGDAAGHVKVTTVGGVVTGLAGARAAAESLIRNVSYTRSMARVSAELWLHDLIRWSMDRFDQSMYDDLLGLLTPSLRALLARRSRDDMAGAFLSLLRTQPRVISLGLRSFLSAPTFHAPPYSVRDPKPSPSKRG